MLEHPLDIKKYLRYVLRSVDTKDTSGTVHTHIVQFVQMSWVLGIGAKLGHPLEYNGSCVDLPADPTSPIVTLIPFVSLEAIQPVILNQHIRRKLGLREVKVREAEEAQHFESS